MDHPVLPLGGSSGGRGQCLQCVYLVGCRWEKLGPSVIEKGYQIGCSSDFWNRYEEDIGIAKDLGENAHPGTAQEGGLSGSVAPDRNTHEQLAVHRRMLGRMMMLQRGFP